MLSTASSYDSDQALLEQVTDSFEAVGKTGHREQVSRQCSEILSTMLEIVASDSDNSFFTDNIPSAAGIFFSPEAASEGTPNTTKHGMEDIIASSIQPALDVQSLASLLINMLLSGRQLTRVMPKRNQDSADTHIELALDGLVDPAVLQ